MALTPQAQETPASSAPLPHRTPPTPSSTRSSRTRSSTRSSPQASSPTSSGRSSPSPPWAASRPSRSCAPTPPPRSTSAPPRCNCARPSTSAPPTSARTLNAVATLDEVLTQRGVELPLPTAATAATVAPDDAQARHRAGAAIQEPLYGDEIEEVLATLPAPFDAVAPELVTTACFGDYYSRGVLSVAEREIISLVAITAIGATAQFGTHIAGAVRAGNSLERVTAALVQALPYVGGPQVLPALVIVAGYDGAASHEAYR